LTVPSGGLTQVDSSPGYIPCSPLLMSYIFIKHRKRVNPQATQQTVSSRRSRKITRLQSIHNRKSPEANARRQTGREKRQEPVTMAWTRTKTQTGVLQDRPVHIYLGLTHPYRLRTPHRSMGPRGAECQLALTHGVWDGQPCVRVDAHGRRVRHRCRACTRQR
jgi:hypothetical protein